jgi:predicted Zn-dependent peptidase
MESIGGELNAYTSKEETMIYTNAPAGYTDRALELISDIVGGASFPAQELEKEREVVIEEIKSYLDSPSDTVFDVFEDLIYAGSSMGHNILGTPESVRKLNSEDCRRFVDKYYTPSNMVIYCADPSPASRI